MKKRILKLGFFGLVGLLGINQLNAQAKEEKKNEFGNTSLTHYLNEEKTRYFGISGYAEIWARYSQLNPGSLINDEARTDATDLSLRRVRLKLTYKPTEKLWVVVQAGTTNTNVNSKSNTNLELLDAYVQYDFAKEFSLGGGRSTWRGLSRFTTGPLNTLLYDIPAYAIADAGSTDITVREMSLYAKGQIGKFDYRVILADPYTAAEADPKLNVATYSKKSTNADLSGYFRYAFFNTENNDSPFNSGTYGGSKKVLSLGVGGEYIHGALWHLDSDEIVQDDDLKRVAVDLFYDAPINKENGTSINAYGMASYNDYGPNYVKFSGANNPSNGINSDLASLNGSGTSMPVTGTGQIYHVQIGGTLPYFNKEKKGMQLQPAFAVTYNDLDALHDKAIVYDAGVSLNFNKMASRLSFDATNRPIFENDANNNAVVTDHKWQFVLKYRIDIK